jgi:glycerophosphoryl diester phosphodiesterase
MSWLKRRVLNFAHQGGSFEGASSTIAAITAAIGNGATAIELDVHATKDRQLVVCHDETVDRTTNASGAIADFTLDELRELDNSYWFIPGDTVTPGHPDSDYPWRGRAPRDPHYGIATVEEISLAFPTVFLNFDIKQTSPDVEPYEALLADELRRLQRRDSVIVSSFHDEAIAAFRAYAPEFSTGAATNETASFFFSLNGDDVVVPPVTAFQVPDEFEGIEVVTPRFVEAAHAHGIAVHVWTINDEATMRRMIDYGVDGVITDAPTVLQGVIDELGVGWRG